MQITLTVSFILLSFFGSIVDVDAAIDKNKKTTEVLEQYFKNESYYNMHITECKDDPDLLIIGLEWGASRRQLSVLKLNAQKKILWEAKFENGQSEEKNELPGYIMSVRQITVKGFSNLFFEVVAGERGVYFYYLYRLDNKKLRKIKFHKTDNPIVAYHSISPDQIDPFLPLSETHIKPNKDRTNLLQKIMQSDNIDSDSSDRHQYQHLNLDKITYTDFNNDGYDDIKISGYYLNRLTLSNAHKIFIYDQNKKRYFENIAHRKAIIKQFGYFEDLFSQ